ncbi:chromosomal replication initiator DnaA domain-containing protein [Cereibacter sphaeroides WS8N]|uniref:chromosomal replication initiator DnaA domain-containing protein n=1 Tax=Cereibacter sphaeroides TaxID=1063 RepID=UPI00020B031C|nr:chromosomal replication initiator DnaA domain-containing protein [Cereibacter sphaeroides]EGJ20091.1 chromosomal replication initiator DnaA domain-containing protein [Cereibacter sphaeroides WS8N]
MSPDLPILSEPGASLDPEAVITAMVARTGFGRETLLSRDGSYAEIVWARHELTWLLREYARISLSKLGHLMGGRDGKTILNSLRRVTQRAAADTGYREQLWSLAAFVVAHAREGQPARSRDVVILMLRAVLASELLTDAEAREAARSILGDSDG